MPLIHMQVSKAVSDAVDAVAEEIWAAQGGPRHNRSAGARKLIIEALNQRGCKLSVDGEATTSAAVTPGGETGDQAAINEAVRLLREHGVDLETLAQPATAATDEPEQPASAPSEAA